MKNTLYITDLDGTLLNSQAELSDYTITSLNHLIEKGMNFSVATARTGATAFKLLKNVNLNQPLILMNGVLIYDMKEERFVKKEILSAAARAGINKAICETGQTGLMYGLINDQMTTYYQHLEIKPLYDFVEERRQKFNKKFVKAENFADVETEVIYFCFLNTLDNIKILYNEIKSITDIRCEMYQDIYSNDLWYLEIFNTNASKYTGVMYLRERYGYERVIGFGDNLNDIPLFKACDASYAVSNAKPEVKETATAIIGANDEDGVVRYLQNLRGD
ncbi:MAG: HAD family hydrolase [Lachnospiraceae bacterium]|nr:HAD family hydrolase [Lachnospiraceae bacterium]